MTIILSTSNSHEQADSYVSRFFKEPNLSVFLHPSNIPELLAIGKRLKLSPAFPLLRTERA
ncbi:hypothetical protein ACFS6F_03400, partial [Halobacillus naozhouensis]|uniref:hypothetical protein n=1 Tax=Halobacillus naozhouensis TaxID=554880 RepID=UPI00363876DC